MTHGLCIICRRFSNGRRVTTPIEDSVDRIVCSGCTEGWTWNGEYIRKKSPVVRYYHQNYLRKCISRVVMKNLGLSSRDVVSEFAFPSWGISRRNGLLRFDIAVPKLKLLLDYNGPQHYEVDGRYVRNRKELREQKSRDRQKVALSKKANWIYIVVSYKEEISDKWVRKMILPKLEEQGLIRRTRVAGRRRTASR